MEPDLPSECLHIIFKLLPPNCIPLAIRQLSKEMRQHYLQHTSVHAAGDDFLPAWAVIAAVPYVADSCKLLLMTVLAHRGDLQGMQQLAQQQLQNDDASPVQWCFKHALCAAAAGGHLAAVQWLIMDQGGPDPHHSGTCTSAASTGQLHVLQWLRAQEPPFEWGASTSAAAARGGHLATLQWLHAHGCPCDECVCSAAAEAGELNTLVWAHDNGCPWYDLGWISGVVTCAARGGHVEVLQYLIGQGCELDDVVARVAADSGHVDAVRWLHGQGCSLTEECGAVAAENGHAPVVQYLLQHGCPIESMHLCAAAASNAQRSMLLWLRENGHAWDADTCCSAVYCGDLATLQWLRQQTPPCPWVERVTDILVPSPGFEPLAGGRMQCLQWALDNGCPWRRQTYRLAQEDRQLRGVNFPGVRRSERMRAKPV